MNESGSWKCSEPSELLSKKKRVFDMRVFQPLTVPYLKFICYRFRLRQIRLPRGVDFHTRFVSSFPLKIIQFCIGRVRFKIFIVFSFIFALVIRCTVFFEAIVFRERFSHADFPPAVSGFSGVWVFLWKSRSGLLF